METKELKKGDVLAEKAGDKAIAAKIDGKLVDLSTKLTKDSKVEFLIFEDEEGLMVFRHSAAHLMAQAITELYPQAKLTIGPVVDEGFYYDIDIDKPFQPEDLKKIERRMHEIMKSNIPIKREDISLTDAKKLFKGNKYKQELIREHADGKLTVYKQEKFYDLCRGPHVTSTGVLKAFKLTKIAGAYWRADSKNKQLQRIYGIAFPEKEMLKKHLTLLIEAEKRDHRKIGKKLDLFSLDEEAGPGFPFFHPKGVVIWDELVNFWKKEHRKAGYVEIKTPQILKKELWVQSGHWDHYKDNMYFTKIDNIEYAIKPMNCPGGMLVYQKSVHSYKDLPLRVGELGLVHRHELSGVLAGLFRVRCFTQDDAHIFMTPEQIKDEIKGVIRLTDKFYRLFGFDYHVELSTMPEKSVGDMVTEEIKGKAENALKEALEEEKIDFKLNEGDGAFYGPKIDFHLKDCIGRTWQCGTIQLDFSMPEKFDLYYINKKSEKQRPVVIHRVVYGALERFIGLLIEHYAGKFPLWFSPVQVRILTVADRFEDYARKVFQEYFDAGIRVEMDSRSESIGKKVREAQLDKVNYILVIGEKEKEAGTVAVRTRDNKVVGAVEKGKFLGQLLKEIEEKSA